MLPSVTRRRLVLPETGIEIALLDWGGDGPIALLAHANGFCGALWAPVAEKLSDRYRVIAMDARGHGDSSRPSDAEAYHWEPMARDVAAVAQELAQKTGQGQIALGVGHSFGGILTLGASAWHPGLYQRIALIDPVVLPADAYGGNDTPSGRELAERASKRRDGWSSLEEAGRFFREKKLFSTWNDRVVKIYLHEALRRGDDGVFRLKCPGAVEAAVFAGGPTFDPFQIAGRQQAEALILHAAQGSFLREVHSQIAAAMPRAHCQEIDGGHLVVMEAPALVARQLLAFAAADEETSSGGD